MTDTNKMPDEIIAGRGYRGEFWTADMSAIFNAQTASYTRTALLEERAKVAAEIIYEAQGVASAYYKNIGKKKLTDIILQAIRGEK